MNDKSKKNLLFIFIAFAFIILISVGATFAYFSAIITSNENAVSVKAAEFKISLEDDTDLMKSNLIPSKKEYVDLAISRRLDENGNFKKPYTDPDTNELIIENTTCIDDRKNEICSIYTFTVKNEMTNNDLPLYITINPSVNTFENLYFVVLDEEHNEVITKTKLVDDREFTLEGETKVYTPGSTISPVVLTNINTTLAKATIDENTQEVIPSTVTYSIVMWIDETDLDQTEEDSGKIFAASLKVQASGADGKGITAVMGSSGVE